MAKKRSQSTSDGGRGPSQRQLRVGEEIRHALAAILARGDVHSDVLQTVPVTVTEVRISPDLRNATAFVMPLGGQRADEVLAALKDVSGWLRGMVGRSVTLRSVPKLSFLMDEAFDQSSRIDTLLRSPGVARDLDPGLADEDEEDDAEPTPEDGGTDGP